MTDDIKRALADVERILAGRPTWARSDLASRELEKLQAPKMTEAHKQSITALLQQLRELDTHTANRFRDMNVTWVWAQTTLDCGPGADRAYIAAEYDRMYPRPEPTEDTAA